MQRPTITATTGSNERRPGEIVPTAVYRLDEVKARMGWGDAAFLAAQRRGLKVHRVGKRGYVKGSDLVVYITTGGGE
jgi:hypothetical protein